MNFAARISATTFAPKEGYVPVPPTDTLGDLRSEISLTLAKCGITVECHHHEVATAGQCEIDFRYSTMLGTADNLQIFKYVVRNTAYQYGKTATFMPKPLFGDNGSGMHCHQSLWKGGKPLFCRRWLCRDCRRWRCTTSAAC